MARPWRKFFNYGDPECGDLDLAAPVQVTDKVDGSLGILYGDQIATRGSFTSDQAVHATDVYLDRHDGRWARRPCLTYLFEIVYPENRIVLDYGSRDELVLLGAVEIATGRSYGPGELPEWHWPSAETFGYRTLSDALAASPRTNAEGMVVRFLDGPMVKVKQEDYVRLHRLITGLNERVIWEHLSEGGNVMDLIKPIPDEFHAWVREKADELTLAHDVIMADVRTRHRIITQQIGIIGQRKDYALAANETPGLRPYLFNILDGRDPSPAIWRNLKPRGDTYMRQQQ